MYMLLVLTLGVVNIAHTEQFETKQGCEAAAKWYNQNPKVNAVCVQDKKAYDE